MPVSGSFSNNLKLFNDSFDCMVVWMKANCDWNSGSHSFSSVAFAVLPIVGQFVERGVGRNRQYSRDRHLF